MLTARADLVENLGRAGHRATAAAGAAGLLADYAALLGAENPTTRAVGVRLERWRAGHETHRGRPDAT